jgi:Co/Zn/Cd efflux system component
LKALNVPDWTWVQNAVNAALNLVCLRLLKRHRGDDVNFKASAIFTSNDSTVNLAIVLSGGLVMWWGSNLPDLILGLVVAAIAANGGREILADASEAAAKDGAKATRD